MEKKGGPSYGKKEAAEEEPAAPFDYEEAYKILAIASIKRSTTLFGGLGFVNKNESKHAQHKTTVPKHRDAIRKPGPGVPFRRWADRSEEDKATLTKVTAEYAFWYKKVKRISLR